MLRKVIMLASVLWLMAFSTIHADSLQDGSFMLSPDKQAENSFGYYRNSIKPGERHEYVFYIRNVSSKTNKVQVYPADALPGLNGGRSFSEPGDKLQHEGLWVSPQGVQVLTLRPGETRQLKYTIQVPKVITPGQHIPVIAASEYKSDAVVNKGVLPNGEVATVAIDALNRRGVQMVLEYDTTKAKHDMSIDAFEHQLLSPGNSRFIIKLTNTGGMVEYPTGKIVVRDSKNNDILNREYKADSIYPQTTADMTYDLTDRVMRAGIYSVYYEATFSGKTVSRTFTFEVTSKQAKESEAALKYSGQIAGGKTFWDWISENVWIVVILLVLLIALLLFLFLLLRRKKEKDEDKPQVVSKKTRDDISNDPFRL